MIDLGLSKLAIIGVVALVVIGPEKLPKVARMAGTLYGRAQRYLQEVKSEVSREIELEELKNLRKQAEEAASTFQQDVEHSIAQNVADVEDAFRAHDQAPLVVSHASSDDLARKAKEFRRKRLLRTSAVPQWYKQRTGGRMHVVSGAARVARFRPRTGQSPASFY
jgi:sec-independent protein translocase protein TatB